MLSRWLQQRTPSPSETPSLDFKSLVSEGSRFGLIDDPEVWSEYRRMRNITSHTYDEATTKKVSGLPKSFIKVEKLLLKVLEKGWPIVLFSSLVLIEKCSRILLWKQGFDASVPLLKDVFWNASRILIWWSGMKRICMQNLESCGMPLKPPTFPLKWTF